MNTQIKYCKNCNITKENTNKSNVKASEFAKGYLVGFKEDIQLCPFCKTELEDVYISAADFFVIRDVSNYNRQILEAMIKLHDEDIVEFELKMSQFRTQLQLQKNSEVQKDNVPRCPTCGSTNIKKISAASKAGSVIMWGIFSRKVHKQWHCNSCGGEW